MKFLNYFATLLLFITSELFTTIHLMRNKGHHPIAIKILVRCDDIYMISEYDHPQGKLAPNESKILEIPWHCGFQSIKVYMENHLLLGESLILRDLLASRGIIRNPTLVIWSVNEHGIFSYEIH